MHLCGGECGSLLIQNEVEGGRRLDLLLTFAYAPLALSCLALRAAPHRGLLAGSQLHTARHEQLGLRLLLQLLLHTLQLSQNLFLLDDLLFLATPLCPPAQQIYLMLAVGSTISIFFSLRSLYIVPKTIIPPPPSENDLPPPPPNLAPHH
jgi:hypothetical protein